MMLRSAPWPPPDTALPPSRSTWLLAGPITLAGVLGVATVWVGLGLNTGRMLGGMAILAGADAVVLLALCGFRGGRLRAGLAVLATLATTALAVWFLLAGRLGRMLGLNPLESAARMSLELATTLLPRALGPWDWLGICAGLLVALGWGLRGLDRSRAD